VRARGLCVRARVVVRVLGALLWRWHSVFSLGIRLQSSIPLARTLLLARAKLRPEKTRYQSLGALRAEVRGLTRPRKLFAT
jgi:hypothetical protein